MSSSNGGPDIPDTEVQPLVETPILNKMSDVSINTPGDFTESLIDNVRYNVRQRRTTEVLAERVASNMSRPFTDAFERQFKDRVKQRIEERITQ